LGVVDVYNLTIRIKRVGIANDRSSGHVREFAGG